MDKKLVFHRALAPESLRDHCSIRVIKEASLTGQVCDSTEVMAWKHHDSRRSSGNLWNWNLGSMAIMNSP